jgi:hypothetical protein
VALIIAISQAKANVGQRLYWDRTAHRLDKGSGILTEVYRRQIEFDDNRDLMPLSHYTNLRTTKEKVPHGSKS